MKISDRLVVTLYRLCFHADGVFYLQVRVLVHCLICSDLISYLFSCSLGIDTKEPPMIGLYPLNNATAPAQPFDEVLSFFSTASETIATTLPNFPISTPSFTTPPYAFNTSVPAPAGEIVSSGLATSTYSAALGTHHANATAISFITPSPTLATFLITDPAGHTFTSVSTAAQESVTLGQPPGWSAASVGVVFPGRMALVGCVLSFVVSFVATFHLS